MRYAAIVLALIAQAALGAGAWERFDISGGTGYWEYDKASIIMLPDNHRRVLARLTLSGIMPDRPTGQYYDHAVFVIELDCTTNRRRVVDTVSYLRAERIEPFRTSEDWRDAGPNSALMKGVCG